MVARIVPLDPVDASDELLGQVWELERQCRELAAPREPVPDRAYRLAHLRNTPASERRWYWTCGDIDGFAALDVPDEARTGFLLNLYVAPAARRRGIGRALLTVIAEQARAAGCAHLFGGYVENIATGFVAAVGARVTTRRVRASVLRLPLVTKPAPPVAGYETVSWVGAAPDELLVSYAAAREAINDAPHDEVIEADRYPPERVRDLEATVARRGMEMRVTVAVDAARTVVGCTELRVSGAAAHTDDTSVVAAHRGRGLALWIKDECLRRLSAERPAVEQVVTSNDVSNVAMLAVNERLGFTATAVYGGAVLEL